MTAATTTRCGPGDGASPGTPRLVLDLDAVRGRFVDLAAALPDVELAYAVKANPHPAVLRLLAAAGASFDVASVGELADCRRAGAPPDRLSWGNPLKKPSDVRTALAAGVHRFTTDAPADVDMLAREAPGTTVCVRLAVDDEGAATPFAGKFGASEDEAVALLARAHGSGLHAGAVGFHVGSQQRDSRAWVRAAQEAARVARRAGDRTGTPPGELNVGGGFPTRHADGPAPAAEEIVTAVRSALEATRWRPRLVAEPGRVVVADAGILEAEVVLVTQRAGRRWVYLDVGRYQGLAETENEMIVYRLRTPGRSGPDGPVVLAGPTCDGDDVLYRRTEVRLPRDLAAGDAVQFLGAGAYTTSYASVGFNGLPPLPTVVVGEPAPTADGPDRPAPEHHPTATDPTTTRTEEGPAR